MPATGPTCAGNAVGEVGIDERPEGLPQALALLKPGDHSVEGTRQGTGLICGPDRYAHGQVTRADPVCRLLQTMDRRDDRVREQDGEGEAEGKPDGERDADGGEQLTEPGLSLLDQPDDEDGDADADRGQCGDQPSPKWQADRLDLGLVR